MDGPKLMSVIQFIQHRQIFEKQCTIRSAIAAHGQWRMALYFVYSSLLVVKGFYIVLKIIDSFMSCVSTCGNN